MRPATAPPVPFRPAPSPLLRTLAVAFLAVQRALLLVVAEVGFAGPAS